MLVTLFFVVRWLYMGVMPNRNIYINSEINCRISTDKQSGDNVYLQKWRYHVSGFRIMLTSGVECLRQRSMVKIDPFGVISLKTHNCS